MRSKHARFELGVRGVFTAEPEGSNSSSTTVPVVSNFDAHLAAHPEDLGEVVP